MISKISSSKDGKRGIILFISQFWRVVKRYITNLHKYKIANNFKTTESFIFFFGIL